MVQNIYRLQAWFEGNVQGVGFRFITCQIAKNFDISGQVKNLEDGRVWLNAEGPQAEVEAFLKEIKDQMSHYIENCKTKSGVAPRTLKDFSILY